MTKRYMVTLSSEQDAALAGLMSQDLANNRSGYLGMLIGAEVIRRKEAVRRPVGRPRKGEGASGHTEDSDYEDSPDYSHDTPKNIPHFGRMIGARELRDIEASSSDFKPQL